MTVDWRVFGDIVHRVSQTGDLSYAGAFVHTADPKPIDTPLVLRILTGQSSVETHARVAWTDVHGMGVRFTSRDGLRQRSILRAVMHD